MSLIVEEHLPSQSWYKVWSKSNISSPIITTDLIVEIHKAYQNKQKGVRILNLLFNIVSFLLNRGTSLGE